MDKASIERTLRELLAPVLEGSGMSNDDVAANESLLQTGILDSFSFMTLLAEAEGALGVEIDLNDMEVEEFTNLNGLVAAFQKALSQ